MPGSHYQETKQPHTFKQINEKKNFTLRNQIEIINNSDFPISIIYSDLNEEISTSPSNENSFVQDINEKNHHSNIQDLQKEKNTRISKSLIDNYKQEYRELRTNIYYKILSKLSAVKNLKQFNAKISHKLQPKEKNNLFQNLKQSKMLNELKKNYPILSNLLIILGFLNLSSLYFEKDPKLKLLSN